MLPVQLAPPFHRIARKDYRLRSCNSSQSNSLRFANLFAEAAPQSGKPANGIVVKELFEDRWRQTETLNLVPFIAKMVVRSKVPPILRVLCLPIPNRLFWVGTLLERVVRAVKNAILILDNELPHLLPGLIRQIGHTPSGINGEIRIAVEPLSDQVHVGFHAAQMRSDHPKVRVQSQ